MNTSKKINVNFSSLVGLKAELLRKQTEIKNARAKEDIQSRQTRPKPKTKRKKDKKVKTEPEYTEIEDIGALKKSRIMLEAKTMLYERLKKSGGDETRPYLVDFSKKVSDSEESEGEIHREEDYEDENSDPEDDWVEYDDCFGRTRKCLRRDLEKMREKDEMVKRDIAKDPVQSEERHEETQENTNAQIEKEPEIEIMRKKWEEQMEKLANKTDIHYQDVLFDEARAHGVGYYAFSQNEEERARQQENLAKLRRETQQRQRESREIRETKSKAEFNRLRAAMIRQKVRSGLSPELTEEEEESLRSRIKSRNASEQDEEEETKPEAIEAAAKRTKEQGDDRRDCPIVVEDKIKAFGELLGKRPKWHEMSQEEWIYKRRRDRLGEFAPVYENFRRGECLKPDRDNRVTTRDDDEVDPVRINSSGPEPTDIWESQGPFCRDDEVKDVEEEKEEIKDENDDENRESTSKIDDDDDSDDEDMIGPLPPDKREHFSTPTFINSFVPRTIPPESQIPLSFVGSIPLTKVNNFPTSSNVASIVGIVEPSPTTNIPEDIDTIGRPEESSDSDDSIIIGPVPPPTFNDFTNVKTNNCGPSLIDNSHLNVLSDIPLPTSFTQIQNSTNNGETSKETPENLGQAEVTGETTGSLDVNKISAGLKYLRQKFENT